MKSITTYRSRLFSFFEQDNYQKTNRPYKTVHVSFAFTASPFFRVSIRLTLAPLFYYLNNWRFHRDYCSIIVICMTHGNVAFNLSKYFIKHNKTKETYSIYNLPYSKSMYHKVKRIYNLWNKYINLWG